MKVIFLDIDGVLQPGSYQDRFEHLAEVSDLAKKLNVELNNGFDYYKLVGGDKEYDNKQQVNKYDIGAVYWDWHPEAVKLLHEVIDKTGAKIVLSTDWRGRGLEEMRGLIDIKGFGKYLYGATYFAAKSYSSTDEKLFTDEEMSKQEQEFREITGNIQNGLGKIYPPIEVGFWERYVNYRTAEVREYLDRHPEITSYVAIDDMYIGVGLDDHFVWSDKGWIRQEHADKMIEILSKEDGPYPLPAELKTKELEEWREKRVYHSEYYH